VTVRTRTDDPLEALRAVVGAAHVLTQPDSIAPYLVEPRGVWRGAARAVVRPASTEEVAAVVRLCAAARISVVPYGGGTGLVGGQIADRGGAQVVLSLRRLNRLREIDVVSDTMTVEAGVTLAEAQAAADAHERLFPLSLASEGSCTIGGNLATNAGGVHVLSYGNARDLTRGVEVVLADGRVLGALGKLRKDNTGYDLKDLFVGSEGTLGVITAATLRLFPKPRARATAFVGLASPQRAVDLLGRTLAAFGQDLVAFELMPRIGVEFTARHIAGVRDPLASPHAWYALLDLASPRSNDCVEPLSLLLADAIDAGVAEDAAVAQSVAQAHAFWRLRETLPEAQKPEGVSIKHDVSVAVADVPRFIDDAAAAIERSFPGARPCPFGHLGDGNVHFNVSQPLGADPVWFRAQEERIHDLVHGVAIRLGGSISAEHGIGVMKRDLLPRVKDPVALETMRAIKRALDPDGVMNPNVLFARPAADRSSVP
jgi:FAD/FMN-containing dehydrogenase